MLKNKIIIEHYESIKPFDVVYHTSPSSNRESILEKGLIPRIGKSYSSNWIFSAKGNDIPENIKIYPAIFAANVVEIERAYSLYKDFDLWQIDTKTYKGNWFKDFAMPEYGIITLENISNNAIKLVKVL